ncbi:MAG: hypothetical protein L3J63_04970 [Geopsychrobacter sp.]|nr:hypothetical protein [Geopsychrobacter sp.]
MKLLLLFLIGILGLVPSAWSLGYTCRDAKGTIHFVDSPLRLPKDCGEKILLFKQQQRSPDDGTTNVPPIQKDSSLLQQMIKADTQERASVRLQQQATDALAQYNEGAELLNIPKRRWHYGRRARKEKGRKLVSAARQAKKKILNELQTLKLSPQRQTELKNRLEPIP